MTQLWSLPDSLEVGGKVYPIHADFRDILEIFSYLEDADTPEFIRWQIALGLFYEGEIPEEDMAEAANKLVSFLTAGREDKPGPRLMDWEHDAPVIVADINRTAGQEIRALPFVHWWTFLSWFHAIGEGQLSVLVSIRDKLRRGKPLDAGEKEFYRANKDRVLLPEKLSAAEQAEKDRLNALL